MTGTFVVMTGPVPVIHRGTGLTSSHHPNPARLPDRRRRLWYKPVRRHPTRAAGESRSFLGEATAARTTHAVSRSLLSRRENRALCVLCAARHEPMQLSARAPGGPRGDA